MSGTLFAKGLAFGFILAATVGPMWVLCLRRTIASGAVVGFVSGMGIAVADGFYGAVAAFGLTAISVGSSRVDLQACKLEYSIVSPK